MHIPLYIKYSVITIYDISHYYPVIIHDYSIPCYKIYIKYPSLL